MVHFEDFDVEILIQRLRNPLDEGRQQVDAHAHVAGFDDHGAFGRLGDQRFAFARKAGGADDVGAARAGRMFGEGNGRGGDGEIDQPVGVSEQRPNLGGNRNAVSPQPGELARVAANHRGGSCLHRAREDDSIGRGDGVDQRAPHAPAGASHDQPHVGHGVSPGRLPV